METLGRCDQCNNYGLIYDQSGKGIIGWVCDRCTKKKVQKVEVELGEELKDGLKILGVVQDMFKLGNRIMKGKL